MLRVFTVGQAFEMTTVVASDGLVVYNAESGEPADLEDALNYLEQDHGKIVSIMREVKETLVTHTVVTRDERGSRR